MISWYAVVTLTVSKIKEKPQAQPLYDKSLMLVEAESKEEAEEKARYLTIENHLSSYKNPDGETVIWEFVDILEAIDLCEESLFSGIQVYSHLYPDGSENHEDELF